MLAAPNSSASQQINFRFRVNYDSRDEGAISGLLAFQSRLWTNSIGIRNSPSQKNMDRNLFLLSTKTFENTTGDKVLTQMKNLIKYAWM